VCELMQVLLAVLQLSCMMLSWLQLMVRTWCTIGLVYLEGYGPGSRVIQAMMDDNIWVMVIAWRLRGNIIRTAPCWVVWHNVHSQQHTHMSSSYRSSRFGLSHWDPYAMHRGSCLELYYCNMAEWCWWDSSLIWKTN